ncbi:MAG: PEP/pyruvate-binding domain-containing protein [Dehalococcoidia bacterium]
MTSALSRATADVVALDEAAAQDAAVAGAKGATLAKLIVAGFPVPEGFAVTTTAWATAVAGVRSEIEDLVDGVDVDDLTDLDRACRLAQSRVIGLSLPDDLIRVVTVAYAECGAGPVSVRSSATAEDQADASFAGQYDSVLNVTGIDGVLDAVRRVWASLYSTRAVAYRRRQGILAAAVQMAVVVQRLVPADAAGVLFTCDPITGAHDRAIVNVAWGLGEGVVAGTAPADRLTLDARTGAVLTRDLVVKDQMIAARPEGGIGPVPVATERRSAPVLTDQRCIDLAAIGRSIAAHLSGPQDVEFALADGTIWILQARPITGMAELDGFPVRWDDPDDAASTWILFPFMPGPKYRLEEDALRARAEGSRICFEETGAPMARPHVVRFLNGYQYTRADHYDEEDVVGRLRRHVGRAARFADDGTSLYDEEIRPEVERILDHLRRTRPRRATLPDLVAHMEQAMQAYARVMGDLHWRMAAAGPARSPHSGASPSDWPSVYQSVTGGKGDEAASLLEAIPNKTTQLIRRLRDLARIVQSDPALRAVFDGRDFTRLDDPAFRARPAVAHFRRRFRQLQQHYGRRTGAGFGSGTGFASPTWNMQPEQPLGLIGAYAGQDLDRLEHLEAEAVRHRRRLLRRIRRRLTADAGRSERFERELTRARHDVERMENHNHLMEQMTVGSFREAIGRLGGRLARHGAIETADDVLHLSLAELRALAANATLPNLRSIVQERRTEMEQRARLRPPHILGDGTLPPDPRSIFDLPPGVGRDGTRIRGVAASRGRVTGRARVLTSAAQSRHLEKGDILVAKNAGPDWTPIFPLLGGLVLDEGAIFQHAALVAREYRIPAVIMTRDATSAIIDGQIVHLDADAGLIDLAPEEAS